jgi:F-type H+-transporting ATPase subunit a
VPLLVLIESISYLARAVSLGIRLGANMIAGKILAYILSLGLYGAFSKSLFIAIVAIIPSILFIVLLGLELGVAMIQAYVFTILTCGYINDAVKLH